MDYQIFTLINNLAAKNPIVDAVGIAISEWMIFFLLITATIVLLRKDRAVLILSLVVIVAILLFDQLLNFLIQRPRPFVENQVNLLIEPPNNFSFPSTHAAIAAAAATAISFFSNFGYLKIIAIVFALLVGFSRIFVGVHYPSDVAAGFVLGIASYIISVKLTNFTKLGKNVVE